MTGPIDAVVAIHNAFRRDMTIIDTAALDAARGKGGLEATVERFRFFNEVLAWHAHGEEIAIDCWSMRDGSSGPYDTEVWPKGGYFWGIGAGGSFKVFLKVDCDAVLGEMLCAEAHADSRLPISGGGGHQFVQARRTVEH